MKRRIISILIILIISISLIPTSFVQAANSKVTITVSADKTDIIEGEEITYTIEMKTAEDISAIQLSLDIPIGLTYIENSGAVVFNVTNDIGNFGEFVESQKSINIVDFNTFKGDITLATFRCKADNSSNGNYEIGLKNVIIATGQGFNRVPENECSVITKAISVKNANQEVGDNGDKKDETSSVKEESSKEEVKDKKTPRTGDNSNMILWETLCVIAGICFIVIARWNTKKSKLNN